MENFIKKNEQLNGHHGNITFECQDVIEYDLPNNRYVIILYPLCLSSHISIIDPKQDAQGRYVFNLFDLQDLYHPQV